MARKHWMNRDYIPSSCLNMFFNLNLVFVFFCFGYCLEADEPPPSKSLGAPWGKDACLAKVQVRVKVQEKKNETLLASIGEGLIRFHQNVISPIDGPRSHYRPSSSQYALDAIKKYGFFVGIALGCDRLMRENKDPWIYDKVPFDGTTLKWDPVDGTRSWFKDPD